MTIAYLGLGSNKGERISYLLRAKAEIEKIGDTKILRQSSVYETEPWGNTDQDEYLNSVIEIETSLDPGTLLKELKSIEQRLGRSESKKWAEREIDIDLLFYGDVVLHNEIMRVPHPQIENRNFVLVPMNELSPDFVHPVLKKTVSQLLKETDDKLKVSDFSKVHN